MRIDRRLFKMVLPTSRIICRWQMCRMASECCPDICLEELRKCSGYQTLEGISTLYICTTNLCIRWTIKYAVFISLNDSAKEIKFSQIICVCNVVAICTGERKGRAVWYFNSSLPLEPPPKEKYSTGIWKISLWGDPWFVTFTRHY